MRSNGFFVGLFSLILLSSAAPPLSAHAIDHLKDKTDIGLNKVPHSGESHILVIPTMVRRANRQAISSNILEDLRETFKTEGGEGTFRDFWLKSSNGLYDPIPTLVEPVYYDECPIDGRDLDSCSFEFGDTDLLLQGKLGEMIKGLLERVRDEQNINLAEFDVNSADCETPGACPDGYFDGVILHADLQDGLAFPLGAMNNTVRVNSLPTDATEGESRNIDLGIVAMIPPNIHEFGHNLGFIDLYPSLAGDRYGGNRINGIMGGGSTETLGLSGFSRLQIGWGQILEFDGPGIYQLPPVYETGDVLKIGTGSKYMLIDNRSGEVHDSIDQSNPGLNIYSINEEELPSGSLGFLNDELNEVYFPNQFSPYLNVSMPLGCEPNQVGLGSACAFRNIGAARELYHADANEFDDGFESDGFMGYHLLVLSQLDDGTFEVEFVEGRLPEVTPSDDDDEVEDDTGSEEPDPQDVEEGTDEDSSSEGCQQISARTSLMLGILVLLGRFRRQRQRG